MEIQEIWKDIPYYNGYQISNMGRIWNTYKQRYEKCWLSNSGYLRVCLKAKNGKYKYELVHRLVALTFIPNIKSFPTVNHKDENKLNNHADNLEWCTYKYNSNYGSAPLKSAQNKCVPIEQYKNDSLIATYNSLAEAYKQTGIPQSNICYVLKGQRNSAGGYQWKYKTQET